MDPHAQALPFGEEFAGFVAASTVAEPLLLPQAIAAGPPKGDAAAVVEVVFLALLMAYDSGDMKAVEEVLSVGLTVLMRWPWPSFEE
jgi:hypothetical protein